MVVPMKIEVFWDMMPCQLAKSYHFPEEFPAFIFRARYSKASVSKYQSTRHHEPEVLNRHQFRLDNMNSRTRVKTCNL